MEYPPQTHDQAFMNEAAEAAARINAQAAGGNVYGAPQEQSVEQSFNEQVYTVPAADAIGRVTGAAVVQNGEYVNESQAGKLYAQYANHEYVAQQQQVAAEVQQRSMLDDDKEEVDA